jgi:hypothetical protein
MQDAAFKVLHSHVSSVSYDTGDDLSEVTGSSALVDNSLSHG